MLDITYNTTTPYFHFDAVDRITLNGMTYTAKERIDGGHVFEELIEGGRCRAVSDEELAKAWEASKLRVEKGFFAEKKIFAAQQRKSQLLGGLPRKAQLRASKRLAYVTAVNTLHADGKLKLSHPGLKVAMPLIQAEALKVIEKGLGEAVRKAPSPTQLREWRSLYKIDGLEKLIDNNHRRGNSDCRLGLEERALMMSMINHWLSEEQPTQKVIQEKVRDAFRKRNDERASEGKPPLRTPSKETVRQAILRIAPFLSRAAREGIKAAERTFRAVGQGLDIELLRPMQRVEMDEHRIDLILMLEEAGIKKLFTAKQWEDYKKKLEKKGLARPWLTAAICARTRCIVGITLTATPSHQAALQVLEMSMRDKGLWQDAVGAETPWNMFGWPEEVVTDQGAPYISNEFIITLAKLGITCTRGIASKPQQRARIERFFHTLNKRLMTRLIGRTFSDVVKRGDLDPAKRAALSVDDFLFAIVRWIVDGYHRTPHAGLNGETPRNCWNRLAKEMGVTPPPDMRDIRMAFGNEETRPLSNQGIEILGVHYHNDRLSHHLMMNRDLEMDLRWHPRDVGAIEVFVDGGWHEVEAVNPDFHGKSADMAAEILKAHRASPAEREEDQRVSDAAMAAIEAKVKQAQGVAGMTVQEWTPEKIALIERNMKAAVRLKPKARVPASKRNGTSVAQGWTLGEDE